MAALRSLLAAALLALAPAVTATAQDVPATLVADRVDFDAERQRLVAAGDVEFLYQGARLTAARVVYDGETDRISLEGPLTLDDGAGVVIVSEMAELSTDLQNGILTGARMVLQRRLQMAAAEIRRVDGRYTQLDRTVASTCRICPGSETPIWQIRAARITHDQQERQLYFENAWFDLYGVPIAYLPRLRLPDPTVARATGFLVPEFRTTDILGSGVKIPYFITLGDHADLTFSPYLTTTSSTTLEADYRHRFVKGELDFSAALTTDELTDDPLRGYFFADGRFDLGRGFTGVFDIELTSDPGYLLEYGYSDKDRLDSAFRLTRTRPDDHIAAEIIGYQSLRESESNETIPIAVGRVVQSRRFTPGWIGGQAELTFAAEGYFRQSDDDGDAGRDALRTTAAADWRRNWTLANGMVVSAIGGARADLYTIRHDSAYDATETRLTPLAAVELRWPWLRQQGGVAHVIEPVAQLVWSPEEDDPPPNEDSRLVEFDETNLFAVSRFPGADRQEGGLRANLGLTYTRHDPDGWSLDLAFGRVIRAEDPGQFTDASGLAGRESDWVSALRLSLAPDFTVTNRAVFGDDLSLAKAEVRLAWKTERLGLETSYVWLEEDPLEEMTDDVSEWALDAEYQLQRHWHASIDWRYDTVASEPTRAGVGLIYENECIAVDLSLSRRFTSSTNVKASTDIGLAVSLNGFGDRGGREPAMRRCSG
ncbi:LPS-assembly protein LptD [Rhodovulum sp. YNF3179]|uniref:LPS-assembly protein LptD n=1 Tax=Rhodovulum sp. YNF3179 TaxID=3425127 RepID=UPI003D33761D